MIRLTGRTSGLFQPGDFKAWQRELMQEYRKAVAEGLKAGARPVVRKIQAKAGEVFKVRGRRLQGSIGFKIYNAKPNKLPALLVGSKIPWMGAHESGGRIPGPLLIPLNQERRIGPKAFRKVVQQLLASGQAFFRKSGGKTILFATLDKANRRGIRRFTRGAFGAGTKVKAGALVPIAVVVSSVSLRARFPLTRIFEGEVGAVVREVEVRIRRV